MQLFLRVILAVALAMSAISTGAHAQLRGPKFIKAAPIAPRSVQAGSPFSLTVSVSIDNPYHIQANPSKAGFIATELEVGAIKGFKVGKVTYPKPMEAAVGGEKLPVYEGKVDIKVDMTPDKSLRAGKYTVPLALKYQGCNEQSCYPPATLNFKATVGVTNTARNIGAPRR